ncbi:FAD-dependent oxidoreductase [Actinoplanes sp. GCM10030250]|uniref:FAD-dependent oxidoreductase n=1 Tax=Actinoplanes sp. GCM10030250 TaxID=3273376 RepID=UPI00360616AE
MKVAVVGAGPVGLFTAIALARRGNQVAVVDRDPGPAADGSWPRRGVMQFHHPHGFRQQIGDALEVEMPEVLGKLLDAGAETAVLPAQDGRPEQVVGLHCRRLTFERVLRATAVAQPGVTLVAGHADDVLRTRGKAAGVRVDGRELPADLVINASGRAGKLADDVRVPGQSSDCGLSYVSRQYELLPGAELGPMNTPVGIVQTLRGYLIAVFLQDNRTFCALIARPTANRRLAALRFPELFEAAARAVPALAAWVSEDRSRPITPVLPGGRLHNTYRGQLDDNGRVGLPGLLHGGDTVCTTNPTAGRGIALALRQSCQMLRLLDDHPGDPEAAGLALDAWCTDQVRPWFDDHVHWDADLLRRWDGGDVDVTRRLPSDLIMEATAVDPSLLRVVGPYMSMKVLPTALDEVEPRAREIFAGGWRPPQHPGPTADELAELITLRPVSR